MSDCRSVIKFLNILCAFALIGIAAYSFIAYSGLRFWDYVFYSYWILFGVLILAGEANIGFILQYFQFIEGNCGKGSFLILYLFIIRNTGTWLISSFEGSQLAESIIGVVLICCGFITIFVLTCCVLIYQISKGWTCSQMNDYLSNLITILMKKKDLHNYVQTKVKPLFDKLLTELLVSTPEDPALWTFNYLKRMVKPETPVGKDVGVVKDATKTDLKQESESKDHKDAKQSKDTKEGQEVKQSKDANNNKDKDQKNQAEKDGQKEGKGSKETKQPLEQKDKKDPKSKDDPKDKQQQNHSPAESDDEVDDIKPSTKKVNRQGVSAEAYGQHNKKEDFKPRVIKKSAEQIKKIKEQITKSFMFQALDEKDLQIVIDAFEEKHYKPGETVIHQGDDGDLLYVVQTGELDCNRVMKAGEQPKYLKTYKPGESFGELALLYNTPRAATIIAKSDSVLYGLDRATFNGVVKDAAIKKRERYEQILQKIDLLHDMSPYERMQLIDSLLEVKIAANTAVIKQGEAGDKFYMISEGELQATILDGQNQKVVQDYKAGDYFGELALMNNKPRQATVTSKTNCLLLTMDSESFKRLMGPVDDILKRNMTRYEKYSKK